MVRAISPEEYDAARRSRCTPCLSAAMGDPRTGERMLLEAERDRRQSLRALAQTRRGRAVLDSFAAALEGDTAALEHEAAALAASAAGPRPWPP